MEYKIETHKIVDDEGSNISIVKINDIFWVESEIFIIRNQAPLPNKTSAMCGPYSDIKSAIDSIPGKISISEVPVSETKSDSTPSIEIKQTPVKPKPKRKPRQKKSKAR